MGGGLAAALKWRNAWHVRVVQLCKGFCMFLEGDFFKQSWTNEFAFNIGIMMAAVWHLTRKIVVSALSDTA